MRRQEQLKPWVKELESFLDESSQWVWARRDLDQIIVQYGETLGLPASLRATRLIDVMERESALRTIVVKREGKERVTKTRYAWRDASPYSIGAALQANAYLSHASAMFIHALTDQIPKTIYVNREQSLKPKAGLHMTQPAINRAFKRPPRKSNYVFVSPEARYVLLSGKNTGGLEVAPLPLEARPNEFVPATKLERTLIDIVVRPAYAGGIREVIRAYERAMSRLSVGTLLATLKKLDHAYPYHQSIGFILEQVGFDESQLTRFEALGLNWDFYLSHQIVEPKFDSRWRVFYPKSL